MRSLLNLYKETGVTADTPGTTPVSPQQIASAIYGSANFTKIFGRISLISTVDQRIDDKAHRILCLIAACAWKKAAPLAFDEIAFAVNCSARTAMRHVAMLEKFGYIGVTRCHNRRNEYALGQVIEKAKAPTIQCVECRRPCRGLDKAGHCRTCATRIEDDRLYAAALMVLGPGATPQQIALHHNTEKQAKRWIAAQRRHELKAAGMARTA